MATVKYTRLRALAEVSEASGDYSAARREEISGERSVVTSFEIRRVDAPTTQVTVDLSNYTTVYDLLVFNHDTTNFVECIFSYGGSSRTIRCDAANWVKISRPTIANDLVLDGDTGTCECEVWIFGA